MKTTLTIIAIAAIPAIIIWVLYTPPLWFGIMMAWIIRECVGEAKK